VAEPDLVATAVDELAQARFDPDRPPWTISLVTGADECWLLAAHLHLALIDGLHAVDLYSCLLAPRLTPPPAEAYAPATSGPDLLLSAIRDLLTSPYEQVRAVRSALRRMRPERPRPAPVEVHRARVALPLAGLKGVKDEHGGSVNDVLAALVSGAVGDVEARDRVTLTVPFAVRSLSRPGQYDNQVEAVHVDLRAGGPVVAHYQAVARELDAVAREHLAVGGRLLGRVSAPTPCTLLALGARACVGARTDAVLVNVPGLPSTGPVFGGRSIGAHAVVPHPAMVRWCVTSVSHAGQVSLAVSGPSPAAVAAVADAMARRAGELTGSLA
jgi:hypothetical protein